MTDEEHDFSGLPPSKKHGEENATDDAQSSGLALALLVAAFLAIVAGALLGGGAGGLLVGRTGGTAVFLAGTMAAIGDALVKVGIGVSVATAAIVLWRRTRGK